MPQNLTDSGFHYSAPFYDWLAYLVFGNSLHKAQLSLMPYLPQYGKVLIIGGGSGWILEQVLLTGKHLEVLYLDAAPAMLAKAKHRYSKFAAPHTCQVAFRLGTEAQLRPNEQFQAIITPFLLDLFPPSRLRELTTSLDAVLEPNGYWLFADFWPVSSNPPLWQKVLVKLMYLFFGLIASVKAQQLPAYSNYFRNLGYKEIYSDSFYGRLVQAKVYLKL